MSKRPDQEDAEREASINATSERISSYWDELWRYHTPDKEEILAEQKAFSEQRSAAWRAEARREARELFNRYRAEFRYVLCGGETDRVSPIGYLALKELERALFRQGNEPPRDEQLLDEAAEEFGRLIRAVEQGREAAIGSHHMIDNIPEGFAFGPQDLPYLHKEAIGFARRVSETRKRRTALAWVLGDYEKRGALREPAHPLMAFLFDGQIRSDLTGSEGRSLEYFGAVLELMGEPFDNPTAYAKAIADRCPKEDGDTPTYQAVLGWLSREGYKTRGQKLQDFRPKLEQLARLILRRIAQSGDGAAGSLPDAG